MAKKKLNITTSRKTLRTTTVNQVDTKTGELFQHQHQVLEEGDINWHKT
jgi:hypothetical protein